MWDPDVYLVFADHRSRPFYDLLSRVGAERARRVVDLGCGPGNLTKYLEKRWPGSAIEAMDTSPEMVAAARERGIDASVSDLREWKPKPDTDVVVSNAALHWVPEHADLLVRWAGQLPDRSWIAVQMPGNFETPSHAAVRAVARREDHAKTLRTYLSSRSGGPAARALRQSVDGCGLPGRCLGDDVPAPADRGAPGAGMDHRHRAGSGA